MVRLPGLAIVLVLAVLGAVLVGPMIDDTRSPADRDAAARGASGIAAAQEFDNAEFELLVHENGSTRWTFRYKRALANETERDHFEGYAERFNSEETDFYQEFVGQAQRLVRLGSEATGRDMRARGFSREARIGPFGNQGIVEMSFVWTNFAVVRDDGTAAVGDVFEGGALDGAVYLGPNQQLTIQTGEGLTFQSVQPDPDSMDGDSLEASDSVTWAGEREFDDGRPSAVLTTGSASSDSLPSLPPAVIGAVLVLLGVAAAVAWRFGGVPGSGSGSGSRSGPGSTPTPGAGSGASRGGGTGGTSSPEPAVSDEELLADDDRVLRLLESNGGRMRQVSIVEETDWSKSKVSMLLSEMEEKGKVSKLRIGRENIVSLAGHEPDTGRSRADED